MMRKLRKLWLLVCLVGVGSASAQDIHFSQFYNSPLTLNPALTGLNDCDFRAAANYRSQWGTVTVPYRTFSGSFDAKLFPDLVWPSDFFGAGLNIIQDQSGDAELTITKVFGSVAYHKVIDQAGKHSIGVGVQGGIVQKSLNMDNLRFPDEYANLVFQGADPNSIDRNRITPNISYMDFAAGAIWNWDINDKYDAELGVSYFHLTAPEESFLAEANTLDGRMVVHAGGTIFLNNGARVKPDILYMSQAKASQINVGGAYELDVESANLPDLLTIGGGMWFRVGDAVMPMIYGRMLDIQVGLSYDFNVSSLHNASKYLGGMELSLIYTFCKPGKAPKGPIIVPCGVF